MMVHQKKILVMDEQGALESSCPVSVEFRRGEMVMFEGQVRECIDVNHDLSSDGEKLVTAYILR